MEVVNFILAFNPKISPKIVRLEMVPNALKVNDGYEVKWVCQGLGKRYHVTSSAIPCWEHGDVSSRERIIIIGLRRDLFTEGEWKWPSPIFGSKLYPIAHDISVPDADVPADYWHHIKSSTSSVLPPSPAGLSRPAARAAKCRWHTPPPPPQGPAAGPPVISPAHAVI